MIHSKHRAPACLFHFLHMKTCSSSSFSVSAAIWQLCGHFGSAPQDAQQLLSSQCRSCGAGSSYIWLLGLCRRPCRSEHTVSLVNTFFFFNSALWFNACLLWIFPHLWNNFSAGVFVLLPTPSLCDRFCHAAVGFKPKCHGCPPAVKKTSFQER